MNNWGKITLGEVCDTISTTYKQKNEKIVLINTSDVLNGKVLNHEYVQNVNIKGQFKKTFIKDDILYSEIRPQNRRYAYIDFESNNYVASTKLMVLRYKENVLPKFLYLILSSNNVINNLQAIAETRSGTFPQITYNELSKIEINLPPIDEQKRIADVLSALDDKIEINNKINENLEAQAQAIFKQWFVDFEFPDAEGKPYKTNGGEFIDSELGEIPVGWKVGTLGEITTNERAKVGNNNFKVLSPVNSGKLMLSEDFFNKQVYSKDIGKYLIVEKDAFAYNPARVNIGSIGRNKFEFIGCVSPVYVVFKTENKYQNFFEEYIKTEKFKTEVLSRAIGGVRQTLNYTDFSLIKIIYPPKEIICLFNQFYNDKEEMIKHNNTENKNLSEIRDSLLPKLMSGEVRV